MEKSKNGNVIGMALCFLVLFSSISSLLLMQSAILKTRTANYLKNSFANRSEIEACYEVYINRDIGDSDNPYIVKSDEVDFIKDGVMSRYLMYKEGDYLMIKLEEYV